MHTVRSDGAHFLTLATPATGIQSSLFEKLTATGTTPPPRGGRVSAVMFSEHLHVSRVAAQLPSSRSTTDPVVEPVGTQSNPWAPAIPDAHRPRHRGSVPRNGSDNRTRDAL